MNDFEKKTKKEMKDVYISKLKEVEQLVSWSNENDLRKEFDTLVIQSIYLENKHLMNPADVMHKFMKKETYVFEINELSVLINELEYIKEKGNLIQEVIEIGNQKRGGKRVGAGRKGFGVTKKVSLTLDEYIWNEIDRLCKLDGSSQSKAIREIIEKGINNQN